MFPVHDQYLSEKMREENYSTVLKAKCVSRGSNSDKLSLECNAIDTKRSKRTEISGDVESV